MLYITRYYENIRSPRCFRGMDESWQCRHFIIDTRGANGAKLNASRKCLCTNLVVCSIQGVVVLLSDLLEVRRDVRVVHAEVPDLAGQVDHHEIAE